MDKNSVFRLNYQKWMITLITGTLVFLVMSFFMLSIIQKNQKSNELSLSKTYSAFQSEAVSLIYENITLLKGYLTLIETSQVEWESSELYLNRLTAMNENFFRNITVIEDTTIKWVYPLLGNEEAIGVDLSEISSQKSAVLLVKEERKTILDGPLDLVQGGRGFVARVPIIMTEGSYWGQLSIVLDADKIADKLRTVAEMKGINVHIISLANGEVVVSNPEVLSNNPLVYDLNEKYFHWQVYIEPIGGWDKNILNTILSLLMSLGVAISVSTAVFIISKTNEELKEVASRDSLTNLYNRHFLEDYQAIVLSRADRYRKLVGFILIDLEKFKEVNDTYGHKIGDQVLKITSDILVKQTRYNETVFRLGGDEFLIVLPDLGSTQETDIVEERLTKAFSEKFFISGHQIQITPNMGTSIYPRDGNDFDKVLQIADMKMYKNKNIKKL